MKKMNNLFFAGALVSALCAGFAACNQTSQDAELQGEDVPFTVFSLGGTGEELTTQWVNLTYEYNESSILVIDSDEEMKKYVEGDYPHVNFSQKTLVLAYGYHSGGGFGIDVKFQKVSDRNYVLTAYSYASAALAFSEWKIAVIVDKLPVDSEITFNGIILNLP